MVNEKCSMATDVDVAAFRVADPKPVLVLTTMTTSTCRTRSDATMKDDV